MWIETKKKGHTHRTQREKPELVDRCCTRFNVGDNGWSEKSTWTNFRLWIIVFVIDLAHTQHSKHERIQFQVSFVFFRELTCEWLELPVDNVNHINKLEIVWNICVRFFFIVGCSSGWYNEIYSSSHNKHTKTKPHTASKHDINKEFYFYISRSIFCFYSIFFWFCSTFIVLSRAFQFEFQRKFAWAQWFSVSKRAR